MRRIAEFLNDALAGRLPPAAGERYSVATRAVRVTDDDDDFEYEARLDPAPPRKDLFECRFMRLRKVRAAMP